MKKKLFVSFLLLALAARGQLLDLDYSSPLKRENQFKINLFRYIQASITTLGHIDASAEILNMNYTSTKGLKTGLSLAGTRTFFIGNKDDKKNNLSYLLNPMGGIVNGSLYLGFPLKTNKNKSLRFNTRAGLKLIQGSPLTGVGNNFTCTYGQLGVVYEKVLFEDALENQRIDFWVFPRLMGSQVGDRDLELFFDNELKSVNYGYGLQTGVEFNRRIRLTFLLNQFANTEDDSSLGVPVLRFDLAFLF